MPLFEILSLLALGAGAWFWLDSLRAREAGVAAARAACAADGLQLLDDTVAIAHWRPARDDAGQLRLRRVYDFEFSDNGDNRRRGSVTLIGSEVTMLYTGPRRVPDIGTGREPV